MNVKYKDWFYIVTKKRKKETGFHVSFNSCNQDNQQAETVNTLYV